MQTVFHLMSQQLMTFRQSLGPHNLLHTSVELQRLESADGHVSEDVTAVLS